MIGELEVSLVRDSAGLPNKKVVEAFRDHKDAIHEATMLNRNEGKPRYYLQVLTFGGVPINRYSVLGN